MSAYAWHTYPLGGWASHGVPTRLQRNDQGKDVEVQAGHHITAPGYGYVEKWAYDAPWPDGFGAPYMVVKIMGNSWFAGGPNNGRWYVGHVNAQLLRPGSSFHTGQAIGLPTHSENAGWCWAEIGRMFGPYVARFGDGANIAQKFVPVYKRGL